MWTKNRGSSLRYEPTSVSSISWNLLNRRSDALMKLDLAAGIDVEIKLKGDERQ